MPGPTYPRLLVVEATPTITGTGATLSLACSTPAVVIDAGKNLDLHNIPKPLYILVKLAAGAGLRFRADPVDAAWFAPGTSKPTGPGNAGGKFDPEAASDGGDLLLLRVTRQGGGGKFAALLQFDPSTGTSTTQATSTLRTASVSGGPIIIND